MSGKSKANYIIGGSELVLGVLLVPVAIPIAIATGATILPLVMATGGVIMALDGTSRIQGNEGIISEFNATLGTKIPDPVHRLRDRIATYFDKKPTETERAPEPKTCAQSDQEIARPNVPCLPEKEPSRHIK